MLLTPASAAHQYLPGEQHPLHEHAEDQLSLVLTGSVAEDVGRRREIGAAFSVVFKPAGLAHRNHFGPRGARLLQFRFPPNGIASLLEPGRSVSGWQWYRSAEVATAFLRAGCTDGARNTALHDLAALLSRRPAPPPRGDPPAWLARILEAIRLDGVSGMSGSQLARDAGVHPVYLARCVRRWCGHSLGEELRLARLARAAERMARPPGALSPIAHASGYSDHPHLCREFRRVTGLTPGRFRTQLATMEFRPPGPGARGVPPREV